MIISLIYCTQTMPSFYNFFDLYVNASLSGFILMTYVKHFEVHSLYKKWK